MKITEQQFLVMWDVLKASLDWKGNFGGWDYATRKSKLEEIVNNQKETYVDITTEEKCSE